MKHHDSGFGSAITEIFPISLQGASRLSSFDLCSDRGLAFAGILQNEFTGNGKTASEGGLCLVRAIKLYGELRLYADRPTSRPRRSPGASSPKWKVQERPQLCQLGSRTSSQKLDWSRRSM